MPLILSGHRGLAAPSLRLLLATSFFLIMAGEQKFLLGVVILAAGRSARMGRPKLLLPWGHTTVLGHLIEQWQALRAKQITVVCAPGNHPLQTELDRLGFPLPNRLINPAPQRGMFGSIQCAAQWPGWVETLTHQAIVLGDQPHLRPATLRGLLDFSAAHPARICQPARSGHGRHPVVLPQALFCQLARTRAKTLKGFLAARRRQVALCELDDAGLDVDIDRPGDYRKALGIGYSQARPAALVPRARSLKAGGSVKQAAS